MLGITRGIMRSNGTGQRVDGNVCFDGFTRGFCIGLALAPGGLIGLLDWFTLLEDGLNLWFLDVEIKTLPPSLLG